MDFVFSCYLGLKFKDIDVTEHCLMIKSNDLTFWQYLHNEHFIWAQLGCFEGQNVFLS